MADFQTSVGGNDIIVTVTDSLATVIQSTGAGSSVISSTINSTTTLKSFVAGNGITIDDNGTELTIISGGLGAITTDDVTEGTNLYFTEQRVDDAIADSVVTASLQLTGGAGNQGLMSWNADEETVDIVLNGSTLQVGQESHIHVRNGTGSTILNGTAVYVSGTVGNSGRLLVAPMIADNTIEARLFIGIATEDIEPNGDGKVTDFGKVRSVNTTAFAEGDVVWVSPTVAGGLTNITPISPNLKIPTGFIITSSTNGTIFVRAEHGIDLHNNHRVEVSNLQEDDVLAWNAGLTRWENHTIGDLGLATTAYVDSQAHFSGDYNDLINTPVNVSTFTNDAGYLTSETDPIFSASIAAGITTQNIIDWSAAHAWGDHSLVGYLTAETDPVFTASPSAAITTLDISNWNTAYGWGDHALAGYATSGDITTAVSNQLISEHADFLDIQGGLAEGHVLVYSVAAGNKWVNTPINSDLVPEGTTNLYFTSNRSINELGDVNAANPLPGEIFLVWDFVDNEFTSASIASLGIATTTDVTNAVAALNIDDLTDVDTSTVAPVQDDVLIFNATSGNWEPSGIVGDIDAALTAILGA